MSRKLHPSEGARFLFERVADDGSRATYRASIYTPDAVFTSTATLDEGGAIELAPPGAPGDLDERLATMAKLLARDAPKRRDDGLAVWPQRLMRWRK